MASARRTIGWELAALLVLKAAGLSLLWLLFFPDSRRPVIDAAATQRHLALVAPQDAQPVPVPSNPSPGAQR